MKLIEQGYEIISAPKKALETLEEIGRTCYKSEDKITSDSAPKFVKNIIKRKHHAMIEFMDFTIRFITNRGITHELVRHRLCSFAQESTRYVKYDGSMEFIRPVWLDDASEETKYLFKKSLAEAESAYQFLLKNGWRPEQAREVLPNSLKTEIVVKANIREWRHIFKLRCAKAAHPQMRGLMIPLLNELKESFPIIFNDIKY